MDGASHFLIEYAVGMSLMFLAACAVAGVLAGQRNAARQERDAYRKAATDHEDRANALANGIIRDRAAMGAKP